jgi:hypothetical protein
MAACHAMVALQPRVTRRSVYTVFDNILECAATSKGGKSQPGIAWKVRSFHLPGSRIRLNLFYEMLRSGLKLSQKH